MGRHQVSQERLSGAMGISQAGLSRRLRCEMAFDLDDLVSIAAYFAVPVTDLVAAATLPTDTRSGSSVGLLDRVLVGVGI